ncbi:G-type lectin S-receptor-like serine/threonine-protein kinase At4g27290 isoform X1 [Cynara cardunculus var. scolymus]|uniref:G-type lectin S-receptor-like serine/threonine-protein kinase At4g27290 isoform X1 n=1 Tax=Cynara cardunculus var. scolymus TaxID=59895 RepID=UPI000D62ABF4|nr:G-type lectin S-receptor-like serine/threonine-protein kinase At4g27290 isoform X1 [Cynara cardunculus var. scolymus]
MQHLKMTCCNYSFVLLLFILITTNGAIAIDTIYSNHTLKDGDTLVSASEIFELGFFSLGNSSSRYLGIRYKNISTDNIVWVANREVPLNDPRGMLKVSDDGTLQLRSVSNNLIWSSQSSKPVTNTGSNLAAQLLDSGNFVLRDDTSGEFIWQSFDHPGNTLLPGMKIGMNLVTGIKTNLTSWKSSDDPSTGSYTLWMDISGYPQLYIMKDESSFQQRLGSWNGLGFSGVSGSSSHRPYMFDFVSTDDEIYLRYTSVNTSLVTKMILDQQGSFNVFFLNTLTQSLYLYTLTIRDGCDRYGICGPYGSCNIDHAPPCACLEGFEPKLPEEWSRGKWSNWCKHETLMTSENGHNIKKLSNLKLPDSRDSWFNKTMSLGECENVCARNVSCTAYANTDIKGGGNGCLLWFTELIDVREASTRDNSGQDIYISMRNPNTIRKCISDSFIKKKKKLPLQVILSTVIPVLLLGFALILYAWRNMKKSHLKFEDEDQKQDLELPLFSLSKIVKATSNFSINNKLGQGGFGAVYKGMLEGGREIAVKRLSKTSRQGLIEFQNEVICIAKLQHRNLVKLLGYCVQGEEKILIYEYMPNKSLDSFLFDENNSLLLDWPQRCHIINGIARGLLYLHQDSRHRIIHRDLKASNILLDSDMNPKISDFGLARMFREYETEANTKKVVGTLGYISPEYAANGVFSVKSDVFSFGVLVLEIVSGKKNRGFSHQDHHNNLLGHAWRLYKEANPLELVDEALGGSWNVSEVLQSIHVGLSCVQQHAEDRPSMSSVIHMLGGEGALPPPKQPGFFTEATKSESESTLIMPQVLVSINEVTITQLDAR